jgi:hypothetical protein
MLLEDIKTVKTNKPSTRLVYDFKLNKNFKQLGFGGQQATAYQHINKPNTVVKTIKIRQGFKDPVIEFVEICFKHSNNPFLPRFYTAKLYETNDSQSQNVLIVTMEKLQAIRKAGGSKIHDAVYEIFKQLRIFPNVQDEEHPMIQYSDLEDQNLINDVIFNMFAESEMRDWLINNTPNPQLAEALQLLNPILELYYSDLHIDNIMFRLTSVGPQLVLMDPVIG